MEVKQINEGLRGSFFIEENGKQLAFLSYVFSNDQKFVIEHTEVDPSHNGKGLGKELIKAAVDFARKHNYKIIPNCSYSKAVFEKTKDFSDVLYEYSVSL